MTSTAQASEKIFKEIETENSMTPDTATTETQRFDNSSVVESSPPPLTEGEMVWNLVRDNPKTTAYHVAHTLGTDYVRLLYRLSKRGAVVGQLVPNPAPKAGFLQQTHVQGYSVVDETYPGKRRVSRSVVDSKGKKQPMVEQVWNYIKQHPGATVAELIEQFGLHANTAVGQLLQRGNVTAEGVHNRRPGTRFFVRAYTAVGDTYVFHRTKAKKTPEATRKDSKMAEQTEKVKPRSAIPTPVVVPDPTPELDEKLTSLARDAISTEIIDKLTVGQAKALQAKLNEMFK